MDASLFRLPGVLGVTAFGRAETAQPVRCRGRAAGVSASAGGAQPSGRPVGCVNSVSAREARTWAVQSCARPADSEELFLFLSFWYLAFRCVLQLVLLRPRPTEFKELEIVVLRHQTGGTSSAGRSSAADEDGSCLPGCCESAVAAIALAVVFWSRRRRSCAGIDSWSRAVGATVVESAGRLSAGRSASWCFASRTRIRAGATSGSSAN